MDVILVIIMSTIMIPVAIVASPIVVPYELYKENREKKKRLSFQAKDRMELTLERLNIIKDEYES